ncbi:MAG: redoxin domain-containing protein [Muribaculaceae bacterium]|nr:redoxin domain-containing protein [Muribaculaceae bacterium]
MKKTIIGIVGFFAVLLASSAFTQRTTAPAVGYLAPALSVESAGQVPEATSLSDYRGKYVLLTFWDCSRADSRLQVNRYQQWFDANKSTADSMNLSMMAVNLDSNPRRFEEIVKRDHLDSNRQFHPEAEQLSLVVENFQLSAQPKTFLIDPDGRIIAVNPTTDQLSRIGQFL